MNVISSFEIQIDIDKEASVFHWNQLVYHKGVSQIILRKMV